MRNTLILIAGILCLFISLLHTIGGQMSLVDPLMSTGLDDQARVEWLGAWHMITLMLWFFAYLLIKNGLNYNRADEYTINMIAILCILFSIAFIGASLYMMNLAPQFVLFIPLAVLCFMGTKRGRATGSKLATDN